VKENDEYIRKKKRSSHAPSFGLSDSYAEESLRMNEYYQPQPRRTRRENPKETRVDLPHFMENKMLKHIVIWR